LFMNLLKVSYLCYILNFHVTNCEDFLWYGITLHKTVIFVSCFVYKVPYMAVSIHIFHLQQT